MPNTLAAVVLAVAAGLPLLWLARSYNALVRDRTRAQNAWGQIDVQLARRHDLIPNLVEAVRGAMQYERDTLEAVVAARGRAVAARGGPGDPEAAAAEAQLSAALGRLAVAVEAHPQLQALRNVAELQEELRTTENRIAFARQHYNDAATRYNARRRSFPSSLVTRLMPDDAPAELWVAPEGADRVPAVDLAAVRTPGRDAGGRPA